MLLNNQEITEEIKEEVKKYLETNDNENMTTQNLRDAAKEVLRGKLIAMQSYLKKQEQSQINNLTLHLKKLEKEEQTKPKAFICRIFVGAPWSSAPIAGLSTASPEIKLIPRDSKSPHKSHC